LAGSDRLVAVINRTGITCPPWGWHLWQSHAGQTQHGGVRRRRGDRFGVVFASLLAHEIAHAIMPRHNGIEVAGMTLWLFGEVAHLNSEPRTPGADLRIAVVRPLTSLAVGSGAVAAPVALGVLQVAAGQGFDGLWLVLIGLFLVEAATAEEQQTRLAEDLHGVRVRDVMTARPVTARGRPGIGAPPMRTVMA
jgi:Zn-dependent protease